MKVPVPRGTIKATQEHSVFSNPGPVCVGSKSCTSTARTGGPGPLARAQTATKVPNNDAQSWREASVTFNHDFKKMWTVSLRNMKV